MAKSKSTLLMTEGNIWKIIISFAIPIFISNLFQQLYNAVDSAVVGLIDGKVAIAAVGTTAPIINLFVGLFLGLAAGVSATVARHFASKNVERLENAVHTGMAISFFAGLVITIICFFISKPLLLMIKCPEDALDLADKYLKIYFLGLIPMLIYNIGSGILQGVGDSKRPLYYLIAGGCINIILDILLVCVIKLGVTGAAIATVMSQVVAAILVLVKLCKTKEVYKYHFKKTRFDKNELMPILKMGIPAGLQSAFFAISNLIIQGFINIFGSSVVAGISAYSKIDAFLYLPTAALGITTMTFASQNFAVQDVKRAKKGMNIALILSISVTAVLIGIDFIVSKPIISAITQNDPEAVKAGLRMMLFLAPFTIVYAFIEVYSGFIKAAGATITFLVRATFSS